MYGGFGSLGNVEISINISKCSYIYIFVMYSNKTVQGNDYF